MQCATHTCTHTHTGLHTHTTHTGVHTCTHTTHTGAHTCTHTTHHTYTPHTQVHTHHTHRCTHMYTHHTHTAHTHGCTHIYTPHTGLHTHHTHRCTHVYTHHTHVYTHTTHTPHTHMGAHTFTHTTQTHHTHTRTHTHTHTHTHTGVHTACAPCADPAQKKGRPIRKNRYGSMDALSTFSEGVDQSRLLSQSISVVPTPNQPNHRRSKTATIPSGWKNMSTSPFTHSNGSSVLVTSQEAVCQTCGIPHDILVIPLQGRTEPVFEEFTVLSERQVGGFL